MDYAEAVEALESGSRAALAVALRAGPWPREAWCMDWIEEIIDDLRDRGWLIERVPEIDSYVLVSEPLDFEVALRLKRIKKQTKRRRPRRADAAQMPLEGEA